VKSAGTLKITFDNTYSILRSKTIQYRFDVDADAVPISNDGNETKASDVQVAL
jgi:hypothetical protein